MERISVLRLQRKYGGQFVAMKKSRVVSHAKTMQELFKELERKGISYGPLIRIRYVHPLDAVCIYVSSD